MRRVSRSVARVALAVAFAFAGPLSATHPEVSGDGLVCEVHGNSVALSWNIAFLVPIEGWVLSRDGEAIARLSPDTMAYRDISVENGEHFYVLHAINQGGDVLRIAACTVIVGDFGMRCRADGRDVHLSWGPILIDIAFRAFILRRDGEIIARLPVDQLDYVDAGLEPGSYRYTVHGFPSEGHEFLVGACSVAVREPDFVCRVDPPEVLIDWSRIPVIEIVHYFVVFRDERVIGRTTRSSFVDRPEPGEHHYEVFFVAGLLPAPNADGPVAIDVAGATDLVDREHFKIGECTIVMPGDGPPPPEELTCLDIDARPDVVIADDQLLRAHDVLLVWQRPIAYDSVVIARNDERVAVIPGDQFWYIDRDVPPGDHTYSVYGVLAGRISRPAQCRVSIPGIEIRPPFDLTCSYVGPIVAGDPAGVDGAGVDGAGVGGVIGPSPARYVQLRWTNGQRYEAIVVVINDHALIRLPGDTTSYRHVNPPPGWNQYEVFGVVGLRRSESVACRIRVPPVTAPPPVENLQCVVVLPVPDRDLADAVDPAVVDAEVVPRDPEVVPLARVLLRWQLPLSSDSAAVYDVILIHRNDILVATLPGASTSWVDQPPFSSGGITYCVFGVVGALRSPEACCDVDLGPTIVPPPQDLECVVFERALAPDEIADLAVVPVEPSIPVPVVRLSWINPIRYARIFIARDGVVAAQLDGAATSYFDVNPGAGVHVYQVWGAAANGSVSRRVTCEVEIAPARVPPVRELTCVGAPTSADGVGVARLSWVNGADDYTAILVVRDDDEAFRLLGNATSFVDRDLRPGVYEYAITAFRGNLASPREECRVVIDGPPPVNLLYFSSGVFAEEAGDVLPVPVDGSGRVTCMASNSDPVQGWSFGVCSDPSALIPTEATIDGTTAGALNGGTGPSFLVINRFAEGATMAAVIDVRDTSDTLPPGSRHSLLRLAYEPGPDARPEVLYPVRYCETLGAPPVAVVYVVSGFEVRPERRPGSVVFRSPRGPLFLRGDANGDDVVNMSDAQSVLSYLFTGGDEPKCLESADANGSREVNIADGVYILQWEFLGGPQPPAPFPRCGVVPLAISCLEPTCPQPGL